MVAYRCCDFWSKLRGSSTSLASPLWLDFRLSMIVAQPFLILLWVCLLFFGNSFVSCCLPSKWMFSIPFLSFCVPFTFCMSMWHITGTAEYCRSETKGNCAFLQTEIALFRTVPWLVQTTSNYRKPGSIFNNAPSPILVQIIWLTKSRTKDTSNSKMTSFW